MSTSHLVDEAEVKLREWLESAAFAIGTRLPAERTLAAQLDCRHYAINRAMGRLIAAGWVARDGYKLIYAGKSPASSAFRCHLIASRNSVHIPGYRRVAKRMDIGLTIHPWLTINESLTILDTLDVAENEGVVFEPEHVLSHPIWEKTVGRLNRRGIPLVCMAQPVPGHFSVVPDNAQALQIAVSHLMELGHREIGLLTAPLSSETSTETLQAWGDLCRKHALTGSVGRVHLQAALRFKDDIDETARMLVSEWGDATALVISASLDPCNLSLLEKQLASHGRRMPEDLSIIVAGSAKNTAPVTHAISSASFDMALMQELAFYLARRAVREKQPTGILPPACCLRIQCQLSLRGSTQPPASPPAPDAAPADSLHPQATASRPAVISPEEERRYEACLREAYPLAARASLAERPRFASIDLRSHVNRPLNFRRGWLGDLPLKQFPPGRREIHGVPFDILGGHRRAECGAIVFQSAVNAIGNSRKLPERLIIPIGRKIRAAYILHGCGYAKFLQTFASYAFHGSKTRIASVPLVSLGQPPAGFTLQSADAQATPPNIQDWWSDYPHMDFPSARMVPIKETNAYGISDYVSLYTLEWINPSPDTRVSHLEIAANPELATSLGVLALTVLEP